MFAPESNGIGFFNSKNLDGGHKRMLSTNVDVLLGKIICNEGWNGRGATVTLVMGQQRWELNLGTGLERRDAAIARSDRRGFHAHNGVLE